MYISNNFLKAGSWKRILVKFTSSQHGMAVREKVNFHILEAKHLGGGVGLLWHQLVIVGDSLLL
jgi:hypothetical protein